MYSVVDRSHIRDHDMLNSKKAMLMNSEGSFSSPQTFKLSSGSPLGAIYGARKDLIVHSGGNFVENCGNGEVLGFPGTIYGQFGSNHEFIPWPSLPFNLQKQQHCHFNFLERHIYPCPVETALRPVPVEAFSRGYPNGHQFPEFDYFVVIDFEATCDKETNPHPQEIIEFPSVIVSSVTGQLEACFQTYVRPTCNHLLTEFCKDLTGIQQIQVDRGVTLSEALLRHDKWLEKKGIKNKNFAVVTWSDWDCRVMLESECRFKKIRKPPYFNRWINLKIPFREVFGAERCNLKEAVERSGLSWQGRAHCGLDDAKNTARLLSLILSRGIRLSFTNSLMRQPSESPAPLKQSPMQHSHPCHQIGLQKRQHFPIVQYHPTCFCGLKSSKGLMQKPGPTYGSVFFGCGNWSRGARCHYFQWASA